MEIVSPKVVVFLALMIFVAGFPSMEVEAKLPPKHCKNNTDCKYYCDVGVGLCTDGWCVCDVAGKKSFDNVILHA
nr:hypothetical protein Iba_chr14aCG4140 [Ipomoea batatas]